MFAKSMRIPLMAVIVAGVPVGAVAQAPPSADRSEVEEKRRQREEAEKRKAEMQVQESNEQREARERVEKKDANTKQALQRAQQAIQAAASRQNQKGMQLMEAAWMLDPGNIDYPFNTGAFAQALQNLELEFRAMAATKVLAKKAIASLPPDSPRKEDLAAKLAKAEERLEFLRGKLPTGVLQVKSDPPSCEIKVEGAFVGTGSGEIESITGQRKIEASCIGYTDHELFVSVRQGDPTSATIRPKQITYFGKLVVKVNPADGVTVFLDDEPVERRLGEKATKEGTVSGKGTREEPYELAARKWIIRFHKDGYDRWHRRIEIKRDQTILVDARLEALNETVEPAAGPAAPAKVPAAPAAPAKPAK